MVPGCRNSGTWGSPDVVKVGPPHLGPPRRQSRPRHKAGRWPPICPRHPDGHVIDNQGEGLGDPSGPPQPGRRHGGLRDPVARQEARLTTGSQPPMCAPMSEEDKLASPGWKLPEDLGTKKMEGPRGAGTEKLSVSIRPPWKWWATGPTPLRRILG